MKSPLFAGRHVHAVPKKGYIVSALIRNVHWTEADNFFAPTFDSAHIRDTFLYTSIKCRESSITLYAQREPLDATARARARWLCAEKCLLLNVGIVCGPPHTMVSSVVLLQDAGCLLARLCLTISCSEMV